jgi:hypothetical protein
VALANEGGGKLVLPNLSDDQIKGIIQELKKDGEISKKGNGRSTYWIPTG